MKEHGACVYLWYIINMITDLDIFNISVTGQQLKTVDCDWMGSVNRDAHHTSNYETDTLVLRRGQTFSLTMKLKRKVNKEHDKITLELRQGWYHISQFF